MRSASNAIISLGHPPSAALGRIVDLALGQTAVVMVAEHRVPRDLKRLRGVDRLEGLVPMRVFYRPGPSLIEIVADGEDELARTRLGDRTHCLGDAPLSRIASSSPVAQNQAA